MFKNYLKIALRNIKKYKWYSLINISGLALGFTCSILIFMFIRYELSYDKHNKNFDRIYKLIKITQNPETGTFNKSAYSRPPLVSLLLNEFPEIITGTRLSRYINGFINLNNNTFYIDKWIWADKQIFDVFTLPFIYGNPHTALNKPFSVVVTNETAQKYFGNENPVGKTVNFSENVFQITGVIKNIPKTSHFKPQFIGSFETQRSLRYPLDWNGPPFHSYILLKQGCDYHNLEKKIQALIIKSGLQKSILKNRNFLLQPLSDVHLKSTDVQHNLEQSSDMKYMYIFSVIAFFIIFIACINYINLSTARSIKRTKEVCVRKVIGAHRSQLMKQFLGESMILTFLSLLLAFVIIHLLAEFFERDLEYKFINNPGFLFSLLATYFFIGILSGCYPAFFLSGSKPAITLKGSLGSRIRGVNLRNILVVIQFSISMFLIIGTLVISGQMNFIRNEKHGFEREHVIVVDLIDRRSRQMCDALKNELLKHSDIKGVTFSLTLPINVDWDTKIDFEGRQDNNLFNSYYCDVDYDFLNVYNMELAAGRNFSREITTDLTGGGTFIINETAAKQLGWENPIGKKIGFGRAGLGTVIGIVKDFNGRSLRMHRSSVVLKLAPYGYTFRSRFMSIKINSGNISNTIEKIENSWKSYIPGYPFDYYFLDEAYDKMYKSEIKLNTIFKYFSMLAIFISCLGLFGLASFTAEQSRKEIGIRKAIGASVQDIFRLLSWKFLKWVILACLIALPIGYFTMNRWLQDFAYRIDLDIFTFLFAFLVTFLIALFTISFQTIKAAIANPAEVLHFE